MITKDNNYKVMRLFFDNPEKKFYIREIARLTNISSTGVIKIVKRLKNEGLLISRKTKIIEEVEADYKGRFPYLKRVYNLYIINDSGIVSFLRGFYEEPEAIILFGSYAEGSDNSKSDIDMAIITKKKEIPNLEKYEKVLKRKINTYNIDLKKSTSEFKNSLANGIKLYGFIEVCK